MFRITCYDSEGYPVTHLTQWDIDQTLVVEDSYILEHQGKLPNFHFCNKNSESALVVETKLDEQGRITADVPNILLQQGTPIIAYVYIYGLDGVEGYAKSLYTIRLPVRPRPKPDDYMYTETEILTWQRLEERMKKLIQEVADDLESHKANKDNPHEVTKAQVGLGNVDNTSDMDKPISTATQAALDDITDDLDNHKNDKNNPHEVTKTQIGLGDVDNTSDADKPISAATQEALDGKADLGEDGKLLPEQLPLTVEPSDNNGSIIINGVETSVYTHPTDPGNKHVPAGGSEGQILEWKSNGDAKWATPSYSEIDELENMIKELRAFAIPEIGTIIQTSNKNFDPNTKYPGTTWQLLQGVFLLGADAAHAITNNSKDGGSADAVVVSHTHPQVAHTHTVGNQSANHTHSQVAHTHTVGNQSANHTHALNGSGAKAASVALTGGFNCVAYYSHTGEGIVTRTFTSNNTNIPSGSGFGGAWFDINASHSHTLSGSTGSNSANHNHVVNGGATTTGNNSANHNHTVNGGATTTGAASDGVVGAGKNMPPYKVVNIWERTA